MALLPTAVHVRFSNRPFWVISCRDGLHFWCPLYPRKLSRLSPTGTAAKGHQRTSQPIQFLPGHGCNRRVSE
jgi:hypothetical protein